MNHATPNKCPQMGEQDFTSQIQSFAMKQVFNLAYD